jgi:hypothetical protein
METIISAPDDVVAAPLDATGPSYIEWPAVFAGATVALATSFVLTTFGAAVGLSAVSPWTSTRTTIAAVSYGAAFWLILVNIWAFGLGGYLSGRMRHRRGGSVASETEFRDGAHGAVVWAFAVTVGAIVAAYMAASIGRAGLDLATSTSNDPVSVATDTLLRSTSSSAALEPTPAMRSDVLRLLMRTDPRGTMAAPDKAYLTQLVATRAGIAAPEAEQRINAAFVEMKSATDTARKSAVVLGFITAATLLLGAVAAWWGATVGGRDRDNNSVWHGLGGRIPFGRSWHS